MRIYDKSFHGSDPLTSRPFSSGHPDGVWLISIIYSLLLALPILGLVAAIVMMLFLGGDFKTVLLAMGVAAAMIVVFLPAILLLFQRSGKIFYVFLFYSIMLSISLVFSYYLQEQLFPIALGLFCLQFWANYYVFRLKQDRLIGDDKYLER
jgi:hypothetical protein